MYRSSKNPIVASAWTQNLVDQLLQGAPAPPTLNVSTLHLVKASFLLAPTTTLAELAAIEADYTGYAAKTLTTLSYVNINANIVAAFSSQTFVVPFGLTVGNDIWGWYLESAGNLLIVAEIFETPAVFAADYDFLNVDISYPFNLLFNDLPQS